MARGINRLIKTAFLVFVACFASSVAVLANADKWGKWQWESAGYLDCEVRFATKSSECTERGKTQIIIIEAKDIPTAYHLYRKKYGKIHQQSGYALERVLPMESHSYAILYEMPLDVRYGYAYEWSKDKSSLSIDFYFGLCKGDKSHCAKARLTFIDMGKSDENALVEEYYQNTSTTQESSDSIASQESAKDFAFSKESKNTNLSQSELDAKIISHAKNAKQTQKEKRTKSNKIKIIASVW
ncbi:hypothetical protein [Helicobacter sp. T3_23-1056]